MDHLEMKQDFTSSLEAALFFCDEIGLASRDKSLAPPNV